MEFDNNNKVVQLCAEGMNREGNREEALALFQEAWEIASTDKEKFIAAHYLARQQQSVEEKLNWDRTALLHALQVPGEESKSVLPSLYLNIGKCHEDLGDLVQAENNYRLAAAFEKYLPTDGYGNLIRSGIQNGLARITKK